MNKLGLNQTPNTLPKASALNAEIGNNLNSFAHDLLQGITTSNYIASVDQLAPYTSGILSDITPDTPLKTTTVRAIVANAEQKLAGTTQQSELFVIVFRTLQTIFSELGIDSAYGLLSRRTTYNSGDRNLGGALSLFNLLRGDQGQGRPFLKAMWNILPQGSFHSKNDTTYSYLTPEGLNQIAISWFDKQYVSLSDMQHMVSWVHKALRQCNIVDQETLKSYRVTDQGGDQSLLSNSIALVRVLQGANKGLGSYIKLLVLLMEYYCHINAAKGENISDYFGYHGNPNSKAITHINEPGKQFIIKLLGLVPNARHEAIKNKDGEAAADADRMSKSIIDFHNKLGAMGIVSQYAFEQTTGEYRKIYTCFKNTIFTQQILFAKYNATTWTGFDRNPQSITLGYVLDILSRSGLPLITPFEKLTLEITLKDRIKKKLQKNHISTPVDINNLAEADFRVIISALTGGYNVPSDFQQLKYLFPAEYFETIQGTYKSVQIRRIKADGRKAIKQWLLK